MIRTRLKRTPIILLSLPLLVCAVMCQHFSGHIVKLLAYSLRTPLATNNHWQNVTFAG